MRLVRGPDPADVIRARLRALLEEGSRRGWVPDASAGTLGADDDTGPADDDSVPDEAPPRPTAPVVGGRHRAVPTAVRVDPGRPGARALWAAALTGVALLLLWTWLQRPAVDPVPDSSPEQLRPAPTSSAPPSVGEVAVTSSTVVVSVVGQVREPGLVTLASGSRVADAVDAAGGLLPEADAASVNLAALVADGQQIAVGVPGAPAAPAGGPASGAAAAGGPVDLNTADAGALDGLPGIGPVLAQRIVEHRDQHGPFRTVDDLLDVPGIGPAVLGRLADAVTV